MACFVYVMVFHCVSGLLQGSVVRYTMSLVPAGMSLVAWSFILATNYSHFTKVQNIPGLSQLLQSSFLFWHWWEAWLKQVLEVIRGLGVMSVHCLGSCSKNWSERQGVHGKAYWKWKVKVSPSRKKLRARAMQVKSPVGWGFAGYYVV
jgi:hypothetical protein